MRAGQDGQADDVHVFLERGGHDHLRRLAQAGVNDLEALVTKSAGKHLGAAVVAVEAGLRDEDLDWSCCSVSHGRMIFASESRTPAFGGPMPRSD